MPIFVKAPEGFKPRVREPRTPSPKPNRDAQLEAIAQRGIDRHLGDVAEEGNDLYEEAYTLAHDALVNAGVAMVTATKIAKRVAKPYHKKPELTAEKVKEAIMRWPGLYETDKGAQFKGMPASEVPGQLVSCGWRNVSHLRADDFEEMGLQVVYARYVGGARPKQFCLVVVADDKVGCKAETSAQ